MASNRSGGGGLKGIISSGIVLLVIASSIIGWAKVNEITSVSAGYGYFKAWSDKLWDCGAGDARMECGSDGGPSFPGGGTIIPGDTSENSDSSDNSTEPSAPEGPSDTKPTEVTKDAGLDSLNALTVAETQTVDYERSEWKHWTGTPCDTRETALAEQGQDVVQDPSNCKVLSGTWIDPYSGDTFTSASDLDLDHVIPLGYVAKHGGQDWSAEKKQQFANDRTQLLAVSAKENRSKSDKGPEKYMPPQRDFHCSYSKIWVSTATKYDISVTEGDKRALKAGLQKC